MTDPVIVWTGAEALRPFLVPVAELEPFPGNPRRGDVEAVRASLRRFGQVRALSTDAGNQRRVIAGHHVRLAALEEGWTHVAAIPHEFGDEEEARAYLLADNRTHDLGPGYDQAELVGHLKMLAELDALEGTGYSPDDLDEQFAALRRLQDAPPAPPPPPPRFDLPDVQEVVLMFSKDQHETFERWLSMVAKEQGTNGVSETVYAGIRIAAERLNQGTSTGS